MLSQVSVFRMFFQTGLVKAGVPVTMDGKKEKAEKMSSVSGPGCVLKSSFARDSTASLGSNIWAYCPLYATVKVMSLSDSRRTGLTS